MQSYEITYLTSPDLKDDVRAGVDTAVDEAITTASGEIGSNTESTHRRLSYPIQKQANGYLRIIQISLEPAKIAELRNTIRKTEGVTRATVIQTDARKPVDKSIFETKEEETPSVAPTPVESKPKKPAKALTEEEVDEKIEEALDTEIK